MSTVVDSVLSGTSSTTSTTTTNSSASEVSVTDFYSLLVTQLQYQDPLNPVENTDFTAQLAQFSSLEALNNIKDSMDTLALLGASNNNLQAMSMIGKHVNATGNIVNYEGTSEELNYELDDAAATVTIKIYESDGSLIRTDTQTGVAAGDASYTWDGTDDNGNPVDQGKYYFSVSAEDYEENAVTATTYAMGEVTGVRFEDGYTYLSIGNKEVLMSAITEITD